MTLAQIERPAARSSYEVLYAGASAVKSTTEQIKVLLYKSFDELNSGELHDLLCEQKQWEF